jgi:1-phosphatidylinositol-3-phosphate 5-kinase
LPSELLFHILSFLPPLSLAQASRTSRTFREHADSDHLWAILVNSNLPSPIHDPSPFPTFKSLYASHHPLWFVVRNKIWFSDVTNTGKLILARYDHRRGAIDGYRLVARHISRGFEPWARNPLVLVHSFNPKVSLWLDDPVVQLDKFVPSPRRNKLDWPTAEIRMPMALEEQRVFSSMILCKKMEDRELDDPTREVWPPRHIPADERVDITYSRFVSFRSEHNRPQRLGEICESAFRVRRWIHFINHPSPYDQGAVVDGISTYSTLNPDLYTPTAEKPYRGIWVGDYSTHGFEFLLILQRYKHERPAGVGLPARNRRESAASSNDDGEEGPGGARNPDGPELPMGMGLEAVKLTGDPHIPRGEISFMADDIGPRGLIRVADEEIFKDAPVVRSRGHIAAPNFRDGE